MRGGYGHVLREAVDRPVRELPAEPRLHELVHRQLPGQRRPIRGRATDSSRPIRSSSTGPTVNRALVDQLVPPGTLARNTGAVWLDTPDRDPAAAAAGRRSATSGSSGRSCRSRPTTCTWRTATCRCATTSIPAIKQTTGPHRADHARRLPRHRRASSASRRSSSDVYTVREHRRRRDTTASTCRSRSGSPTTGAARFSYGLGYGRGNTSGGRWYCHGHSRPYENRAAQLLASRFSTCRLTPS